MFFCSLISITFIIVFSKGIIFLKEINLQTKSFNMITLSFHQKVRIDNPKLRGSHIFDLYLIEYMRSQTDHKKATINDAN